ncbi:MAG: hypothetical protein U1F71_12220 [Verrucomicrobiaceae bacterium]
MNSAPLLRLTAGIAFFVVTSARADVLFDQMTCRSPSSRPSARDQERSRAAAVHLRRICRGSRGDMECPVASQPSSS